IHSPAQSKQRGTNQEGICPFSMATERGAVKLSKISLCVNRGLRGEPRDPAWARLSCLPGLFLNPFFTLSVIALLSFHCPSLSQINFLSLCRLPHCEQIPHCEDTGTFLQNITL
uniref:Uncharacterized protein n=1 Tax=Mastacembelus armatus TaxID=205130 RepID=A0A3Q3M6D1_9TELE